MGLPARIALPIFAAFAIALLGILGWFLRIGFGTTGAAFGPPAVHEQGDARIEATAAPIATDPPGTFTVPQTGTGPVQNANALPGASTGGGSAAAGPPAPVTQEFGALRARLARNPNDLAALVRLADMEFDSRHFAAATAYFRRALALDPSNPDVRTDYAVALHDNGHDLDALAQVDRVLEQRRDFPAALFDRGAILQAIGRRSDAAADFRRYLRVVGANGPRADEARSALQELSG